MKTYAEISQYPCNFVYIVCDYEEDVSLYDPEIKKNLEFNFLDYFVYVTVDNVPDDKITKLVHRLFDDWRELLAIRYLQLDVICDDGSHIIIDPKNMHLYENEECDCEDEDEECDNENEDEDE
jgi:hypothetical protein